MRSKVLASLIALPMSSVGLLRSQTPCPNIPVVVDSPEDKLMLDYNGADTPQEQVTALNKFAQEHQDSRFIPCVNEYLTVAYLKLNNNDKAIESGEKDVAINYSDLFLVTNLLKAYIAAGKPTDAAFSLIAKAPDLIKAELSPARPSTASDADWQKIQSEAESAIKDERAFMDYAFFQLLSPVTDPTKRVQFLDAFVKAYPDRAASEGVNYQYFMAYQMSGNMEKSDEYGEKAVASDPNNTTTLAALAFSYATRNVNLDKAETYAQKVVQVVPTATKPQGLSDDQFKAMQNADLGLAHFALGIVEYSKATKNKSRRIGPAVEDLKTAGDLLSANPALQGGALYYLGSAYEYMYPPNHHLAADALERSSSIEGAWQKPAEDLLAKVKKAEGH
jgi:tetratricopeptide (TPR) repeat protein